MGRKGEIAKEGNRRSRWSGFYDQTSPHIFIRKQFGYGWSLNMAHPASKIFVALLLGILIAGVTLRILPEFQSFNLSPSNSHPNSNHLLLGDQATTHEIKIPTVPMQDFDALTRDEIIALRSQAVARVPGVIASPYIPSAKVYGSIGDRRPWWGLTALFLSDYYPTTDFGGLNAPRGVSLLSQPILNPLVLVTMWLVPTGCFKEPLPSIRQENLDSLAQDAWTPPSDLIYFPAKRQAHIAYNTKPYLELWHSRGYLTSDCRTFELIFSLTNPHDLGFQYVQLSSQQSTGITIQPHTSPFPLNHMIHVGGSCRHPGGCNNASPPTPEADGIFISAQSAKLVFKFWNSRPANDNTPSDLDYIIEIS